MRDDGVTMAAAQLASGSLLRSSSERVVRLTLPS